MKKTIQVLLVILLLISLTGCTTVGQVTTYINMIGTVTLYSEQDILAAEVAYNDLFSFSKKNVENYQKLVDAKARYNELVEVNNQLHNAADEIGTISLSSCDALTELRSDYNSFVRQYKPEEFRDFQEILLDLEHQYDLCVLEDKYQNAEHLYAEKKYEDALTLTDDILESRNKATFMVRCTELQEKCRSGLADNAREEARALLDSKKPVAALDKLDSIDKLYRYKGNYHDIYNAAIEQLQKARPKSGKVLDKTLGSGKGVFKVKSQEGMDFCIKLESVGFTNKYILFYVRGGEPASVKVPDGVYTIKYCTGEYWCDTENYFYPTTSFTKADSTATFKTTSTQYTCVTITLYPVENGNMSTDPITKYEF